MANSRTPFLYFRLSNTISAQLVENKICQWLNSNCRPLVSEATALQTGPIVVASNIDDWKVFDITSCFVASWNGVVPHNVFMQMSMLQKCYQKWKSHFLRQTVNYAAIICYGSNQCKYLYLCAVTMQCQVLAMYKTLLVLLIVANASGSERLLWRHIKAT